MGNSRDGSGIPADIAASSATAVGHRAEFISVDEARSLVPGLELGETSGILLSPRDGWVDPKSLAVAFAAGARDRGDSRSSSA